MLPGGRLTGNSDVTRLGKGCRPTGNYSVCLWTQGCYSLRIRESYANLSQMNDLSATRQSTVTPDAS